MVNTRKGFKLTPTDKDKRIEELEAQIEKMKCCDNCKFGQNRCYLKDGTGNACEEWEMK